MRMHAHTCAHVCLVCAHVCVHVCAVSGRGRESRAEVGGAAVRLPQSWQLRRCGLHI